MKTLKYIDRQTNQSCKKGKDERKGKKLKYIDNKQLNQS